MLNKKGRLRRVFRDAETLLSQKARRLASASRARRQNAPNGGRTIRPNPSLLDSPTGPTKSRFLCASCATFQPTDAPAVFSLLQLRLLDHHADTNGMKPDPDLEQIRALVRSVAESCALVVQKVADLVNQVEPQDGSEQ